MNYRIEFPDYPESTMPEIPRGFEDSSWHNDACPSFINESAGLIIFVDYAEPSQREFPETARFQVGEWETGATGKVLSLSDDWADIQAYILARAFAAQLLADIGPDNLAIVNNDNASNDESVCASHDFCDSNMSMHAAFKKTFGREPAFLFRDEGDAIADSDLRLWSRAWAFAKGNLFFLPSARKEKLAALYVKFIGYDPFEDDAGNTESSVAKILAEYVREYADFELIAEMVRADDLDEAIGNVQEFLDVQDGGFAAIHFDGLAEWGTLAIDRRTALVREYMAQEILHYLD